MSLSKFITIFQGEVHKLSGAPHVDQKTVIPLNAHICEIGIATTKKE